MYRSYEVSPVVDVGGGSMVSFLRYQDATELCGTVEPALYGIEDDGCRRHICDEGSLESMRALLRGLFGCEPDPAWAGDRIVFKSPNDSDLPLANISEAENRAYIVSQLKKLGF